ncbi:MAG TPA: hypothetical protein VIS96_12405 [Terrimicrobiaceae bacterium]
MNTQFNTLFTVAISHAYYSDNCQDIRFIIPGDAAQLFKNGKLLARERDGKLHVIYEADDAGAALIAMSGKTVRIGLRLANPFFGNFTEGGANLATSRRLYRNSTSPTAFDPAVNITLTGPVFGHTLTNDARPATITLKDSAGQAHQSETISASDDRLTVSYDLTGQAPGTYTLDEVYPASAKQTLYYLDSPLLQAGVFGVLEVEIANGFYASAPEFQIPFDAREETLNYYVVARNYSETDLGLLSVVDAGFTDDGRSQIAFNKIPSGSFTSEDISPALLGENSARVVLFRSQAAVKRTEKARKKIQLTRNGDVLVAHLPQPGPESSNADLIIPISKP